MSSVARHLGVAKPTLYRMAGSREELIHLAVNAEAERLLGHVHRSGVRGLFDFAGDSPAGFLLLFGGRYPEARQAVRRVEARLAVALTRADELENAELAAAGLLGMAAGIVRRSLEEERAVESERLGSVFDGLAKAAARISDCAA
jgi:hypothetical protein